MARERHNCRGDTYWQGRDVLAEERRSGRGETISGRETWWQGRNVVEGERRISGGETY